MILIAFIVKYPCPTATQIHAKPIESAVENCNKKSIVLSLVKYK
jgi:hypothetical protein